MDKRSTNFRKIFDVTNELTSQEKDELFALIQKDVRRKRVINFMKQISAAAAVILFIFLFFYKKDEAVKADIRSIAQHNQTLFSQIDTVQVAFFDAAAKSNILDVVNGDERLTLTDLEKGNFKTVYVPFGKRQEVMLPDGSTVWLNAGSYLTYSDNFLDGDREVYLNGEGYFDVTHTGKRFTVITRTANVNVLGTTFNASAYEDEDLFAVELLTGKIELNSVSNTFKPLKINPGERISLNVKNNKLQLNRGANGEDILWTKKQLALKGIKLRDLLKRLERVYNVTISTSEEVNDMNINYSGRLNVGVDIITSLGSIYELKDYEIELNEKEVSITRKR